MTRKAILGSSSLSHSSQNLRRSLQHEGIREEGTVFLSELRACRKKKHRQEVTIPSLALMKERSNVMTMDP